MSRTGPLAQSRNGAWPGIDFSIAGHFVSSLVIARSSVILDMAMKACVYSRNFHGPKHEFKVSLGYIATSCLQGKKKRTVCMYDGGGGTEWPDRQSKLGGTYCISTIPNSSLQRIRTWLSLTIIPRKWDTEYHLWVTKVFWHTGNFDFFLIKQSREEDLYILFTDRGNYSIVK